MTKEIQIKLSNGANIKLNVEDFDSFYDLLIEKFLKPIYLKNNDWQKSLKEGIDECERISVMYEINRSEFILGLLATIEGRLAKDISELTGVDKIEIIFEGIEDYVADITDAVQEGGSQEELRIKVSKIVEYLNLFEISELLIHYAKQIPK